MTSKATASFLTDTIMGGGDWRALELGVSRLIQHCGWTNIQYVGESGDKGADILAVRANPSRGVDDSYLIQVKAVTSNSYVGKSAIDQAIQGQAHYGSRIVIIATNGEFTKSAYDRRDDLNRQGYEVRLWNGRFMVELISKHPEYGSAKRPLRQYQADIVDLVMDLFNKGIGKALFVVATGLGKTVVASTLADILYSAGLRKALVLCHSTDLANQLQSSFWSQISKEIPTRLFMDGEPPVPFDGINFGLYQTLFGYLGGLEPTAFDVIIVDEAHHAVANAFSTCIEHLTPKLLIGMTATPWRGDNVAVESIFGEAIRKVSLIDGMKMGYLAKVDYRIMCDNIDWEEIPRLLRTPLSIRDLNKRLFIPQRDDAVIAEIHKVISNIADPRIVVFSPSIRHAEIFADKLVSSGISAANMSIPDKVRRRHVLLNFSSGKIRAITAVDVLNEGIDIPDVNVLVFLRATHSRRIFVQQLGRGLRISSEKDKVIVLDFVTDVRRLAAARELDKDSRANAHPGEVETIVLGNGIVTFSNEKVQEFVDAWLDDVASLQDRDDAEKLVFPDRETWS